MAHELPLTAFDVDLKQLPASGLIAVHTSVVNELLARHLGRTRTAPAAELPDLLVAEVYGDEASRRRLLVRSRMQLPSDRPSATYSPISDWDFDAAVFLVLDATTCGVIKAMEVPVGQVKTMASAKSGQDVARIRVDVDLLSLVGARDVTTEMEKALAVVDATRFARRLSDDAGVSGFAQNPTGVCMCGCGEATDSGARFLVMHDRRADSPVLRERYGTIAGLAVD